MQCQHLEKANSSKKVSHFISFFSEDKPKSVPCRTAKTLTENFQIYGLKTQNKDSRQPSQNENERGILEKSQLKEPKIVDVNSIQISG